MSGDEVGPVEGGMGIVTRGLGAVSRALPIHWPQNLYAWFIKTEAQFKVAEINPEETCFFKVLAVLPEKAAVKCENRPLKLVNVENSS